MSDVQSAGRTTNTFLCTLVIETMRELGEWATAKQIYRQSEWSNANSIRCTIAELKRAGRVQAGGSYPQIYRLVDERSE